MTGRTHRALPSVWATAQKCSASQRKDRYVPDAIAHPAKMLPAAAAEVIARYSQPGDLVADPMCGIGTTLIEAIHQGRHALGIEYEQRWARLTATGIAHAKAQGASGQADVLTGDARELLHPLALVHGPAALVVTSPPYGGTTHGHVRSTRNSGRAGVQKRNHRYSADRNNLAHQSIGTLLGGFGQILSGCRELVRPGGIVAVTIRPIRVQGELIDLPGEVIRSGELAGLVLADRIACLLCGLRDDGLVPRASFFQMYEASRCRTSGVPVHSLAHEDLLIFARPARLGRPAGAAAARRRREAASESRPEGRVVDGRGVECRSPGRHRRERHVRVAKDPVAVLQLGICRRCGKHRYGSRTKARRAARLLHPGERLSAYRCRSGDWHIGHSRPVGTGSTS